MKDFNKELAQQGHSIIRRDGKIPRIICFDKKGNCSIVSLTEQDNGEDEINLHLDNGRVNNYYESPCDLFMKSIKKIGWINIYRNGNSYTVGDLFFCPFKALAFKNQHTYQKTAQIEWDE